MTRITFYERDGVLQGFESAGHAGYAEAGYDIVCAAVSAQVSTCINSLEAIAGVEPQVMVNEKKAVISATLPSGLSPDTMHDCQIILKVLQQGMKDLAEEYPQFINLGGKLC